MTTIRKVDTGSTGPVSSTGPEDVSSQQTAKTESPQNQAVENVSPKTSDAAEATARAGERAMTGQLIASQLQSQVQTPSQGTVGAASSVSSKEPNLIQGSVGPPVKDIQHQLNEWRARNGLEPIKEDGIFGPKTDAAVRQFQEANGLDKDGIVGGNTRDRLKLENNENFQKLDPDTQQQIRDQMIAAKKDPDTRKLLLLVGTDEEFGKLSRAEQSDGLNNLGETASGVAERQLQGMNNEDLLKLAESPGGDQKLADLKFALQQGQLTPAKQKQLDRIDAATFKPAGGIKLSGNAADKAAYLHMVRREMLTSPTFAKTMNEINADKAHPMSVTVGRDLPRVKLDRFSKDHQEIDLNDFDKMPTTPPASNPHAITQGEVLTHAMREARQAALGQDFDEAHKAAIIEENEYRKEIGQTTFRKLPPDDEDRVDNNLGGVDIVVHFDNAPDEVISFDNKSRIQR